MQRSVRENIALPFSARLAQLGADRRGAWRSERVDEAIGRLQIDTRAQAEVQRLSGGNQQKVTIARWIATGARTVLCFDPTRGIDVGTKREIYRLLRELAAQGTSVLLYTSELEEVQLVCDRAVVIFGGRVVDTIPAAEADEPTLMRAAYGLPRGAPMPAAPDAGRAPSPGPAGMTRFVTRNAWVIGLFVIFGLLLVLTQADPAQLRRGRHRLAGPRRPALRLRRGGPDGRGDRRRHRSLDRLDDGAHQRHRGGADGRREPGIRDRRGRRWCSSSACVLGAINGALIVITRVPGHRRHARHALRLAGRGAPRPRRRPAAPRRTGSSR